MKKKINWKILIACILIVFIIGFLGSIFTTSAVKSAWYLDNKSSLTPPNYIFPIAWNILFLLLAISLYFSYTETKNKSKVIILYGINLFLNLFWSILFFGLKNPSAAFIDLIFLWLSILSLIIFNWKTNRKAAYLLIPYLLWVSFAGILNYLFI